jgi:outer membrane protein TolC
LRHYWAIRAAVAVGFGLAMTGTGNAASLEKELAGLILDHPNITAAIKTVQSSRKEVARIKSEFLPTITATADIGQELVDSPAVRAAAEDGKIPVTRRRP